MTLVKSPKTHLLDGGLAEVLRATHADLSGRWRERMLADHARAAVLDAADRLGRRLVLMVENLQSLCGDVEEGFAWQLRRELQMEPRIMLLAATLMPLIIALRQRMGVEVRAPTEMLEVTKDIRKQIERITATGALAARASSFSGR